MRPLWSDVNEEREEELVEQKERPTNMGNKSFEGVTGNGIKRTWYV